MGKPFLSELDAMPGVYEWAEKAGIGGLDEFTRKAVGRPLYVVGSGGSFSAAVFASLLHQSAGSISKAVTPLEFAGHTAIERESSVLIISAGGNNSDALSAFRITQALDPENIGVLCASTGGKLAEMARGAANVAVHEAAPPTGRDGFLATNTLVSTMVWLLRSHRNTYPPRYAVPGFSNLGSGSAICAEPFRNAGTVIVLYDYWGKAAAVDAESKLAEGGLANVQLVDYRNFAHGRHNWIRKHGGTTGMLAFVTPQCRPLAESTLGWFRAMCRLSAYAAGFSSRRPRSISWSRGCGLSGRLPEPIQDGRRSPTMGGRCTISGYPARLGCFEVLLFCWQAACGAVGLCFWLEIGPYGGFSAHVWPRPPRLFSHNARSWAPFPIMRGIDPAV